MRRATLLGRLLEDNVKELSYPVLPAMLSARECYQHAGIRGWKALDVAARAEVLRLAVAISAPSVPFPPIDPEVLATE